MPSRRTVEKHAGGTALALVVACALTGSLARPARAGDRPVLRVCADPNNLPFSNQQQEGFENEIASLLARSLGAELRYTWWAQRRGFVRNTLKARLCDVIIGVPTDSYRGQVSHTRPYYRSSYVFVTRSTHPAIHTFDDPVLRHLRIGIPLVGDDGANPPPEQALARRGIVDNVVGFPVYGDYARPNPPLEPLAAVVRGHVDAAVVWGPLAGYFARSRHIPLRITAVVPAAGDPFPFAFDMSLAVRPGDDELRARLERALERQRDDIERILRAYGIPRA